MARRRIINQDEDTPEMEEPKVTKPKKKADPNAPTKIKFIKTGGGTLRLPSGRIIKPQQKFMAYPDEIPKAFRDIVTPLEDIPKQPLVEPAVKYFKFQIPNELGEEEQPVFNVIETVSGKPMNENPLSTEEADKLLRALT